MPPGDFGPFHRTVPMRPGELKAMKSSFEERFPPLSPERERAAIKKWTRKPSVPKQLRPCTYLVGAEGSPLVKIGYTGGDPKKRLASLQTGQPMTLSLLWSVGGDYEDALHQRFADYRVRGEWFDLTPLGDPVAVVREAVESGLVKVEEVAVPDLESDTSVPPPRRDPSESLFELLNKFYAGGNSFDAWDLVEQFGYELPNALKLLSKLEQAERVRKQPPFRSYLPKQSYSVRRR